MYRILVIADDLTGANATGILFKKQGINSISFVQPQGYKNFIREDINAVCINTDSRSATLEEAYKAVNIVTKEFCKDYQLINKRIDSTLRGNIGSEIDGVLDALNSDYKAIVVAAYPDSRKIVIGGHLVIDNIPLECTEVANDTKTPVKSSNVIDIISTQSKYSIEHIPIGEVLTGHKRLSSIIRNSKSKIIVIDAVTNVDIGVIAKSCLMSNIPFMSVDPGPFTAELAQTTKKFKHNCDEKIFMVIGSNTELTRNQITYLKEKEDIFICNIEVNSLLKNFDEVKKQAIKDIESNIDKYNYFCLTTTGNKNSTVNFKNVFKEVQIHEKDVPYMISQRLNCIAKEIIEVNIHQVKGLYLTGGDTLQEFLKCSDAYAINLLDEVMPLIVYGEIVGGKFDKLRIVTKGGLIGRENTLLEIIKFLEVKSGRMNKND